MRALAGWCFTHRRLAVLGWLLTLVALTGVNSTLGSTYNDDFQIPGAESFQAIHLLERNAPEVSGDAEQIVIAVERGRVTDPRVVRQVRAMLAAVARLPHVSAVSSPYDGPNRATQI